MGWRRKEDVTPVLIAKLLKFQPEVWQKIFNCLKEDYNTVVKTSAIKELLLNFELELKKLRNDFC